MARNEIGKIQTINNNNYYLTFKHNFVKFFNHESLPLITKIETVDDNNKSLNNKYFILFTPSGRYCVYLNVDDSSVGPQVSSLFSLIEIPISENDTAQTIASNIKTQLDNNYSSVFTTTIDDNELTVTNVETGGTFNYVSMDGNTEFLITIVQHGTDIHTPVKSEIPDDNLYEVLDVSVNDSGDLTVLGIYKKFNKNYNEYNFPVWNEEFFKDSKTYSSWVSLV